MCPVQNGHETPTARNTLTNVDVPPGFTSLLVERQCDMQFDEFTGAVQHRLELPDTGRTVRAIRATLMTIGERIPEGNAEDLAANLPLEIKWYMTGAVEEHGQRFDWKTFVERVSDIEGEGVDPPEAAYHARIIIDLVASTVPPSDFQQLRDLLPENDEDWHKLFEIVDAGGWSDAMEAQTGGGPQSESGDNDGGSGQAEDS